MELGFGAVVPGIIRQDGGEGHPIRTRSRPNCPGVYRQTRDTLTALDTLAESRVISPLRHVGVLSPRFQLSTTYQMNTTGEGLRSAALGRMAPGGQLPHWRMLVLALVCWLLPWSYADLMDGIEGKGEPPLAVFFSSRFSDPTQPTNIWVRFKDANSSRHGCGS